MHQRRFVQTLMKTFGTSDRTCNCDLLQSCQLALLYCLLLLTRSHHIAQLLAPIPTQIWFVSIDFAISDLFALHCIASSPFLFQFYSFCFSFACNTLPCYGALFYICFSLFTIILLLFWTAYIYF